MSPGAVDRSAVPTAGSLFLLEDAPLSRRHYIGLGRHCGGAGRAEIHRSGFCGCRSASAFFCSRLAGARICPGAGATARSPRLTGLFCLLPYFYASAKFTGTPFFPLLGPGLSGSRPGRWHDRAQRRRPLANVQQYFILDNSQLEIVLLIALGVALYALHRRDGTALAAIRNLTLASAAGGLSGRGSYYRLRQKQLRRFGAQEPGRALCGAVLRRHCLLALLLDWRVVGVAAGVRGMRCWLHAPDRGHSLLCPRF